MNTVEKFEGDLVRVEEVMENPKNRQMWDLWLQKMEFGIESSRKEICRMELQGFQWIFKGNKTKSKNIWRKNKKLNSFSVELMCDDSR